MWNKVEGIYQSFSNSLVEDWKPALYRFWNKVEGTYRSFNNSLVEHWKPALHKMWDKVAAIYQSFINSLAEHLKPALHWFWNQVARIRRSISNSLAEHWIPALHRMLNKVVGKCQAFSDSLAEYWKAILYRIWTQVVNFILIVEARFLRHFAYHRRKYHTLYISVLSILIFVVLVLTEVRTSWVQAWYFSNVAQDLTFQMQEEPATELLSAPEGPYDKRLGYTHLPQFITYLSEQGFQITAQAHVSGRMQQLVSHGVFPIYHQKDQAGLTILAYGGDVIYKNRFPDRVYQSYSEIPPILVKTLLFIENRALLDENYPFRNPAVEWNRLGKAVLDKTLATLGSPRSVSGGSTLATQLEKVRHSPNGITKSVAKKGRQMLSATFRSYLDGGRTVEAQKRIVLNYVNSVPLAAISGYGEVIGLIDGMWAWYGIEFEDYDRLLTTPVDSLSGEEKEARAVVFKHALSLFLAHRRPSYYLTTPEGRQHLDQLTDHYLELLSQEEVISPNLHRGQLHVSEALRSVAPGHVGIPFTERKAANTVRKNLRSLLQVDSNYELDLLDLTVQSTYNQEAQKMVTDVLRQLQDRNYIREAGLGGDRLISGDPEAFNYAIALYERTPEGNKLRVEADNFDGPLNINEGSKLELGSTAKLRTLVNYLEIINNLYKIHADTPAQQLRQIQVPERDALTRWALTYLAGSPGATLQQTLEAAMERRYSASTAERFFTGGSVHTFNNFDKTYEGRMITVNEAFSHSVNLPFIRLMRDIVYHYAVNLPGNPTDMLDNAEDPRRQFYLSRFADKEGRLFLDRFYRKYQGLRGDALLHELLKDRNDKPIRAAWLFRSVRPEASVEEFLAFMGINTDRDSEIAAFKRADIEQFNWHDRGYVSEVHPLELWLVAYLYHHPKANRSDWMEASVDVRQEVYEWLFSHRSKRAQDKRIWQIIEEDAFAEIHRAWQRIGYPFGSLVPSYATAIGTSADRPEALAGLVGIILNDGIWMPMTDIEQLHFAGGTPYETIMRRELVAGERVLSPELSAIVREAMIGAVEQGTAGGISGMMKTPTDEVIPVGAKTGTGDNRVWIYGADGSLLGSKPMNRTSTLVFFIGNRFFGTVTVFVSGNQASGYRFTSSLSAQLLRHLGPGLQPLFGTPTPLMWPEIPTTTVKAEDMNHY